MPPIYRNTHGFTLVEVAIVIVIIGLLTGAVLGGQAMIRNAELQSIVSDYNRYKEAVTTFKKQYNAIPGDMADAEEFWGQSTACGGASATGTCNGDGDSGLGSAASAGTTAESYQFWRQLALAGRIVGTYSGLSSSGSAMHSVIGENSPAGRISGSGWDAGHVDHIVVASFSLDYGNYLAIGREYTNSQLVGKLLTPKEAWNLDTKIDDGKPGRGTIIASYPVNECALAANVNDLDAAYKLTEDTAQCSLFFIQQF